MVTLVHKRKVRQAAVSHMARRREAQKTKGFLLANGVSAVRVSLHFLYFTQFILPQRSLQALPQGFVGSLEDYPVINSRPEMPRDTSSH